jgi:hypothetical protein
MSQPEMYVDSDGSKHWFLNGVGRHREDGPAIELPNGTKFWYLNGKVVTWQQVFKQAKTQEQEIRILLYVST